jgi:hypothetical protein
MIVLVYAAAKKAVFATKAGFIAVAGEKDAVQSADRMFVSADRMFVSAD